MTKPYGIYITDKARQKLAIAANLMPDSEISGFGRTELVDEGLLVTDIFIPPQEVGGAHVEIKNMWQTFFVDAINGKYNDGVKEEPTNFRLWWHKHPGSGKPGPSGTDTDSLKWLANDCGFGWMAGVIISARAETVYGWLNVGQPNSPWPLRQDDVPVVYLPAVNAELEDVVKEQMKGVTKPTYANRNSGTVGNGSHWHKDTDERCYCANSDWNHRPGTKHRHQNRTSDCYCVRGIGHRHGSTTFDCFCSSPNAKSFTPNPIGQGGYTGGGHQPLLPAGRTTPSGPTGTTGDSNRGNPASRPAGTDWTLVKGVKKLDNDRVEVTYQNGAIMVLPDRGQVEAYAEWLKAGGDSETRQLNWQEVKDINKGKDAHGNITGFLCVTWRNGSVEYIRDNGEIDAWVDWIRSSPQRLNHGNTRPPKPIKKPGERAPKAIKNRVKENIKKYDIVPLLDSDDMESQLEWSTGAKVEGDTPIKYGFWVDRDNNIILGFDDEGDPVLDLFDGDEQWVYYTLDGQTVRAIDRSMFEDQYDMQLLNPEGRIAYYRSKYLLDPSIADEDVEEYVKIMTSVIDADDDTELVDEVDAVAALSVDESK